MKRCLTIIIIVTAIVSENNVSSTNAVVDTHPFVRTTNYFLLSGPMLDQPNTIKTLASFDLIVIPLEAQIYNPTFFKTIRTLNKNIIILAYVPTVSWNDKYWTDPLHQAMYANIKPEWWLKDGNGKQLSVWPNTRALNLNSGWSEYLPAFVRDTVMASDEWDGIFYDEVQDSISWVGQTDVNNDDIADTATTADILWAQNYKTLFQTTREVVGNDKIIITNGSSNPAFAPYVNGRMFETFPSANDTLAQWKNMTRDYLKEESSVESPINIINVNTKNTGIKNDYQSVRFGLTTTLLGNGYFGFDFGTMDHAQLWTYDEYSASLGQAKGNFLNAQAESLIINHNNEKIDQGVWQREFERGRVVVNATSQTQTISLNGEFEKIHGTQDKIINDGSIVSEVTLSSKDGIILLRPIETIANATFRNGAFARIFDINGKIKRTGFFSYDNGFRGGIQIVHIDYDHDGRIDTITADQTFVRVFDANGNLHASFAPYGETFDKVVNIAVGDLENDGAIKIITGTLNGGGPQVRIFNPEGKLINPGFFAYDKKFRGGVNVAIGDVDGDGIKEIITGAGVGGGPHVRLFNKNGKPINPGFFAYDKKFRGGVNVAVGDIDGDEVDDIITSQGVGGSPEVRVFNGHGKMKSSFFASDQSKKEGVKITVSDLDGDGIAEIITLSTDVFTLSGGR